MAAFHQLTTALLVEIAEFRTRSNAIGSLHREVGNSLQIPRPFGQRPLGEIVREIERRVSPGRGHQLCRGEHLAGQVDFDVRRCVA